MHSQTHINPLPYCRGISESSSWQHCTPLQACWLSWTLVFHTALPQPKSFKSQILPLEFRVITGDFRDFFFFLEEQRQSEGKDEERQQCEYRLYMASTLSALSAGVLLIWKAGESGDVRLILDTKGERVAECKKRSKRLGTWQDCETAEWTPECRCWRHWKDTRAGRRSKTFTLLFLINPLTFSCTLTSERTLRILILNLEGAGRLACSTVCQPFHQAHQLFQDT